MSLPGRQQSRIFCVEGGNCRSITLPNGLAKLGVSFFNGLANLGHIHLFLGTLAGEGNTAKDENKE
jgi:hypothetical protein